MGIQLRNGTTATAPVGDVGPWNGGGTTADPMAYDDCYWEGNARPQAESGTDKRGRKTNGAGIDVSQSLWVQLGLDPTAGQTSVRWRFTEQPADGLVRIRKTDGSPDVTHKNTTG